MLSLDLDAYLHVPVHQQCHKYLRFEIMEYYFQFVCLPFGLSTSPRTFSKVLLPAIARLCKQGLRVFHYLDDVLLVARTHQALTEHWEILVRTWLSLGWIINWQKSQPIPTQKIIFFGAILDTEKNMVELPPEKATALISRLERTTTQSHILASHCLRLLGSLAATIPIIKWAHWRMRTFQVGFLKQWKH